MQYHNNNPFACLFDDNGDSIDHVFCKKKENENKDKQEQEQEQEEEKINNEDYNQLLKMCHEIQYDCWVYGTEINTIGIRSENYEQIIMTSVKNTKYEIRVDIELSDEECLKYINVLKII